MKIAMMGTGYVGLVTGACLANLGNDVICVDIDEERIANLRRGIIPFFEPGLREVVEQNSAQKRLMFTTDAQLAIEHSDIIFIAVGTPSAEDGTADLSAVFGVAATIARFMNGPKTIVVKSTVPVGTNKKVKEAIQNALRKPAEFDVVSNPEFLREGDAVQDFMLPDRVVIGSENGKGKETMAALYKATERTGRPIIFTDITTAELLKYASNAMLASRISFMNELSCLCEKVGADIKLIAKGIGLDHRIGPRFLQAGVGYGGSCFPKDVKALAQMMKDHSCPSEIMNAIESVNQRQKLAVLPKVKAMLPDIKGKKVAIWGLSFKPKTDDMREASSITIINELQKMGAKVAAFDPVAQETARKFLKDVTYSDTPFGALEGAHLLIIVTEWDLFRELDKQKLKQLMAAPNVVDGRNMYDPQDFRSLGFTYAGIGRP
jgi:UDPglucose 6-dehydrogenase